MSLTFAEEMIVASTRDLTPADLAREATLNAEDRVVAALEEGPAYPDEIAEITGLASRTVKNKITALKKAGRNDRGDPEPDGACAAVAAEVLGDGIRWDEVREEVETAFEEDTRG